MAIANPLTGSPQRRAKRLHLVGPQVRHLPGADLEPPSTRATATPHAAPCLNEREGATAILAVESPWRWRLLAIHIEGVTPECGNSPIRRANEKPAEQTRRAWELAACRYAIHPSSRALSLAAVQACSRNAPSSIAALGSLVQLGLAMRCDVPAGLKYVTMKLVPYIVTIMLSRSNST